MGSRAASKNGKGKNPAGSKSSKMRTARRASIQSIVRRLFQRSTKTPAMGPIMNTGREADKRIPLTASGAHDCPCAICVAIQRMRIVSKTKSPIIDMICPLQSKAKLRLMSKAGFLVEISDVAELFFTVLLHCVFDGPPLPHLYTDWSREPHHTWMSLLGNARSTGRKPHEELIPDICIGLG